MAEKLESKEEVDDIRKEKMAKGSVPTKTYWEYLNYGGSIFSMVVVFLGFVISQLLDTSADYLLS